MKDFDEQEKYKNSKAIVSQLKVIDVKRLISKLNILDTKKFEEIKKAIRFLFR